MRCPSCGHDDSRVLDSRAAEDGAAVRRRRQCLKCETRFTTYERIDELPVYVMKRSGDKELFDRAKIVAGLEAATKGRPVTPEPAARQTRRRARRSVVGRSMARGRPRAQWCDWRARPRVDWHLSR
ncbi:MAG: transcriptional repressor NrdR [Actinobacteria bacterium]|nr:transcriptional repressor NrdR [Actinomycetota bacterium]